MLVVLILGHAQAGCGCSLISVFTDITSSNMHSATCKPSCEMVPKQIVRPKRIPSIPLLLSTCCNQLLAFSAASALASSIACRRQSKRVCRGTDSG